jgi:hypothetical protein
MSDVPQSTAATPPSTPAPPLRPLTVADLVDEIFRLYRRDFRLLFAVAAIVWLPASIALLVLNLAFFGGTVVQPSVVFAQSLGADYAVTGIVAAVVSFIALPVLFGSITAAVAARYLGRPITVREAIGRGLRCYWRILFAYILLFVGIFVIVFGLALLASGLFAAAIGGARGTSGAVGLAIVLLGFAIFIAIFVVIVWLVVTFAFIGQVIVVEDTGVRRAFGRSRALAKRSRLRILGINILLGLIQVVLFSVPSTFVAILATPFPGVISVALTHIVTSLAEIAYFPIQLGALTLLYYDLRVRREGFDLTLAAEQLSRT